MLGPHRRAGGVADGQEILDLGCGWGSLTLWLAERFPRAASSPSPTPAPSGEFVRERRASAASRTSTLVDRRHERRSRRTSASTAWSRSRCSSTCGTTSSCCARIAGWLDAGRQALRARLRPPRARLPLRGPRAPTTGWRSTSSPAASCRRPTCCSTSQRRSASSRSAGAFRARTTSAPAKAWLANMDAHREALLPDPRAHLRGRKRGPLVAALARVLHGLRRAVRLPRRRRLGRGPLPLRAPGAVTASEPQRSSR